MPPPLSSLLLLLIYTIGIYNHKYSRIKANFAAHSNQTQTMPNITDIFFLSFLFEQNPNKTSINYSLQINKYENVIGMYRYNNINTIIIMNYRWETVYWHHNFLICVRSAATTIEVINMIGAMPEKNQKAFAIAIKVLLFTICSLYISCCLNRNFLHATMIEQSGQWLFILTYISSYVWIWIIYAITKFFPSIIILNNII